MTAPAESNVADSAAASVDSVSPFGALPPVTTQPMTRREARDREAKAAALARRSSPSAAKSVAASPVVASPVVSASIVAPATAVVSPLASQQIFSAAVASATVESVPVAASAFTGASLPRPVSASSAGRPSGATQSVAIVRGGAQARHRPSLRHRVISRFASVGAMAGVALILISTTVPANAFSRVSTDVASASESTSATAGKTQELRTDAIAAPSLARDSFTVLSIPKPAPVQVATNGRTYSFTNDPSGTVQWPFAGGAPIASGFGPRHVTGCGFCSTYHQGLDFTPGSGAPIQSIADGVVSLVQASSSGLGNHVVVDHVINGQKVQSVYGHMQYGSIQVAVGQTITVGQLIGLVGSTGASTGAHLHLEIHLDGVPVDPFAWLQANAN